jgi:NADP-dependent 3-hydroxy acid dehydrogenase YdfG
MNIVVSGSSKGIGRAIALKFALAGYQVAVSARGAEALISLEEELKKSNPTANHLIFRGDMSVKADVVAFAELVKNNWQTVDILVNNAGIFIPGSIYNEPEGNLEKMMSTNLYSAYHLSRLILPLMMERKTGFVFNICSIASFTAYPNGGSYAISKFALLGFSKCLREEMKPHGIRVCAVMPGATLTDSWSGVNIPEERFIPSADIAEIVFAAAQLSPRTVVEDIIIRPQLGDI